MPGTMLMRAGYLLMCWALLIGYACLALIRRLLLVIVFIVPSLCFAETAVEIIPGVTHYGGHSTSVEIIPGHKQYYGEIKGSATEITPGIQHYHLERSSPYSKPEIQRDATRRYSPSSQIHTPSTPTLRGQ